MLYLTVWDFQNAEFDGICKKIRTQVNVFREYRYQVEFCYTQNGEAWLDNGKKRISLGKVPAGLNILLANELFARALRKRKYDAVYIRHSAANPMYVHLLSVLRRNCSRIVLEMPTYPYDQELRGNWRLDLGRIVDKWSIRKVGRFVDRIVTYQEYEELLGVPTIRIVNGIDFSNVPMAGFKPGKEQIDLVGVAMLSPWHGFDRVIDGLARYNRQEHRTRVCFHIVGEGTEAEKYRETVRRENLEDCVFFCGKKMGKELDEIFEGADIGVSSIGLHRIGLKEASPLKDREYGARGLVFLADHRIDFLEEKSGYLFRVPADDTPVDISELVDFYEELKTRCDIGDVRKEIRQAAERVADMKVTLKPVIDFMQTSQEQE